VDRRGGSGYPRQVITTIGTGDVFALDTGNAVTSILIRIGEALDDEPSPANHVAIAHHQDKAGTWWGIEGRPGGVGWVDMAKYLDSPLARFANSNAAEVRSDAQRAAIAEVTAGMLRVGYDWVGGITCDTLDAVRLDALGDLIDRWWGWHDPSNPTLRPGHVVCSSLAAWVYRNQGLPCPPVRDEELCLPSDWWEFNASLTSARA
jgi:hypothetical protein